MRAAGEYDWARVSSLVRAVVKQGTQEARNPARLVLLQAWEPDPDNAAHYTTVLQEVQRVAQHVGAQRVVADQGEGAHQAEVPKRVLGGRFVP